RALEHRDFGSLSQLVEMLGIAARLDVKVGFIAGDRGGFDGRVPLVGGKFLEGIIDLLAHQIALLDPSLDTARGADAAKTAFAIQHFDTIAVFRRTHLVVNLRQLVAQGDLRGGDVVDLKRRWRWRPQAEKQDAVATTRTISFRD